MAVEMDCFSHEGIKAIGACRGCGRGLCDDCVIDTGRGLACRGRCEAWVSTLNSVNSYGRRSWRSAARAYQLMGGAGVAAAVGLAAPSFAEDPWGMLTMVFPMLGGGIVLLWAGFRLSRKA
jgi:hypothetical protein